MDQGRARDVDLTELATHSKMLWRTGLTTGFSFAYFVLAAFRTCM
jgi:hypothetical protein